MRRLAPLALAAALLTGCFEPNRAYWMSGRDGSGAAILPSEKDPEFYRHLAVVEIDEQGDLWDAEQIKRAQEMIRSTKKSPLLFIYVHGWQTNARPSNKDLQTFSWYLDQLSENPRIASTSTVCGVFVGWRGASFPSAMDKTGIGYLPRFGSFWSRLDATNRVAGVPLTRAIAQVVSAARTHPVERGISILLGYSFGGRVLERTLGQALVMQHAFSAEQDGAFLPADLTILINSASEAIYSREIKLALKDWHSERPAIISMTADTDLVTTYAWPFGQTFQHLFGGFRRYDRDGLKESQRSYVFTTAGHQAAALTHDVDPIPTTPIPGGQSALAYNMDHATPERFYITDRKGQPHAFSLYKLPEDRPGALPVGGYWVMAVPPMILQGHGGIADDGGIFSPQITEMLAALYCITNAQKIQSTPRARLTDRVE